ncbi:MAG: hypothetical protein AAGF11_20030 [Myxococcota bacterium]
MNANDTTTMLAAYALNELRVDEDPWHELATGGLTPAQVRQMRRHIEPVEQIEAKLALFSPTTEEANTRRLDVLLQQFLAPGPEDPTLRPDPQVRGSVAGGSTARERPTDETSPKPGHRWRTAAFASVVAIAAAVLLTWVLVPSPPGPAAERMAAFELRFEDRWSGSMRGAEDLDLPRRCDARYHRARSLSVRLVPSEALATELSVAAFARSEHGEARWLQLSPKQRDNGVLSIEQPVAMLGLTPGAWMITFYVSPRGRYHDAATLRSLEVGSHPGVTVAEGSVCIVD